MGLFPLPSVKATLDNRPLFTSLAFLQWRRDIVTAKERPTYWIPQTEYYVSESTGNDANAGTEVAPWQTLEKAQQVLDALSDESYTVIRLKRGDTWEEEGTVLAVDGNSCLLRLTKTFSGISSYGSGDLPFINQFATKYTSGWTVHSGNVYVRSEANDIVSVRLTTDRLVPFYDATDATDCATDIADTNGSYFYDATGNNLYVNLGGTDPNTVTIEAAISNDDTVEAVAHGCFIENIRLDGTLKRTTRDEQAGIRLNINGSEVARIENCEAYYGSSHLIHQNGLTGTGGIGIIKNCKAGYSLWNTGGNTIFNSYTLGGDQETYVQDCEVPYGTLPGHEWTSTNSAHDALDGSAFYCHAGGGANTGFILVDGMKCDHDNAWGPQEGSYNGSAPAAATIEDAKVVVFGEVVDNSRLGLRCFRLSPANGVGICNTYTGGYGTDRNYRALSATNQSGFMFNCRFDVSLPAGLFNAHGFWNGSGTSNVSWFFNRFIQRASHGSHDLAFNYDSVSTWPDSTLYNNVIARVGTYDNSVAMYNGTPDSNNNALYQFKGANAGANSIDITTEAEAVQDTANVDTYGTWEAANTAIGVVPEYDRLLNPRTATTSIGDLA